MMNGSLMSLLSSQPDPAPIVTCDVCRRELSPGEMTCHLTIAFDDQKGDYTDESHELDCCRACAPTVAGVVDQALAALWALLPDEQRAARDVSPRSLCEADR